MANTFDIKTEEETFEGCFSIFALERIEAETGKSILTTLTEATNGDIGVTLAVTLLQYALEGARRRTKSGNKPITRQRAQEILEEIGFIEVITLLLEELAKTLGVEDEEDAEKN